MTVVVKKIGGSIAVVIPKTLAAEAELVEGSKLELSNTPQGIIMRKSGRRPRRPLRQIVSKISSASYSRHRDLLTEKSVGKESW